jgi:hypothetical protein
MAIYCSEVKYTYNPTTGKSRFFLLVCGAWRRISEADYKKKEREAFRQDTFYTTTKGGIPHHHKILYFSYPQQLAETKKTTQQGRNAGV